MICVQSSQIRLVRLTWYQIIYRHAIFYCVYVLGQHWSVGCTIFVFQSKLDCTLRFLTFNVGSRWHIPCSLAIPISPIDMGAICPVQTNCNKYPFPSTPLPSFFHWPAASLTGREEISALSCETQKIKQHHINILDPIITEGSSSFDKDDFARRMVFCSSL